MSSNVFVSSLVLMFKGVIDTRVEDLSKHISEALEIEEKKVRKALSSFDWGLGKNPKKTKPSEDDSEDDSKGKKKVPKTPKKIPKPAEKETPKKTPKKTPEKETPKKTPKKKKEVSLQDKIGELEDDKYYNVDTKKACGKNKQTLAKYKFYDKFRICGKADSDALKDALKSLGAKDTDKGETIRPKNIPKDDKPKKPAPELSIQLKKNEWGNYWDKKTKFVFSKELGCAIGKQKDDGKVVTLDDEDKKILKKNNWPFKGMKEEEVDDIIVEESIADEDF